MISLIKNVFFDITLLYKNFLHWNASKVIIYVYALILSIISVIPLVFIYFIYAVLTWNSFIEIILAMYNWSQVSTIFWNIVLLLFSILFPLVYFFSYILIFKLNLSYIDWKKLKYKKNSYFDFVLMRRFFLNLLLFFIIISSPILIMLLLTSIFIFFMWGVEWFLSYISSNTWFLFPILSFLFVATFVISSIYLAFRFFFSFFILIEKDYWVFKSLKKSFKKTSWFKKLLKSFVILLISLVVLLPFNYIWFTVSKASEELYFYSNYLSLEEETASTLYSVNEEYYDYLTIKYDWVNLEEANNKSLFYSIVLNLFVIFSFLFYYGFMPMLLTSMYKRVIA